MTPLSPEELEAVEKLVEKVTKGPWVDHNWDPMERPHVVAEVLGGGSHCRGQADIPATCADSEFIAKSRDLVPRLIASLRESRLAVEQVRRANQERIALHHNLSNSACDCCAEIQDAMGGGR